MRYVEIVTGRARQRGIGGNHEASARQRAQTHLGATAFHWSSGVVSASRPRRPGSTGSDAEVGRAQPAERDARVGGNVRVPPGNGGGPDSGGAPALGSFTCLPRGITRRVSPASPEALPGEFHLPPPRHYPASFTCLPRGITRRVSLAS